MHPDGAVPSLPPNPPRRPSTEEPDSGGELPSLSGQFFGHARHFFRAGRVRLNDLVQLRDGLTDFVRTGLLSIAGRGDLRIESRLDDLPRMSVRNGPLCESVALRPPATRALAGGNSAVHGSVGRSFTAGVGYRFGG